MEYKSSAGYQPITNLLGLLGTQYNQEIMISWYNRILEALKKYYLVPTPSLPAP